MDFLVGTLDPFLQYRKIEKEMNICCMPSMNRALAKSLHAALSSVFGQVLFSHVVLEEAISQRGQKLT